MEKQRWEESEKRRAEERRSRKSAKKKDAGARKGSKVAKHYVYPMICGSGGSKSKLAKAEPCGQMRSRCGAKHIWKSKCTKHTMFGPLLEVEMSKKCTLLWREAHFQVKMYKKHHVRTAFGSGDVEKVHAVVARSTFRSQKCKKLRGKEHFWTFRCGFAWPALLGGPGADFLRGVAFWSIKSSGSLR